MPITVEWFDVKQTVILFQFDGQWVWDEFYVAFDTQVNPMLKSISHSAYLIFDFSQTITMPMNGALHARNVFKNLAPNWEKSIVVSDRKFIQIVVDLFQKMNFYDTGNKTLRAKTLDEALQIANLPIPIVRHPAKTQKAHAAFVNPTSSS